MNSIVTLDEKAANQTSAIQATDGPQADVFTQIYEENTNIAVWQRQLDTALTAEVAQFTAAKPSYQSSMIVSPKSAYDEVMDSIGPNLSQTNLAPIKLGEDIALLVDMFCCLFDLKYAGLRLSVLNNAMCPRFHVDRVPCRLITTYQGLATEWLPHNTVDRSKLGLGNQGLPDESSGLFKNESDIQRLNTGDVAILKGEIWPKNENAGLVHRSPVLPPNTHRLLLTLDFSEG